MFNTHTPNIRRIFASKTFTAPAFLTATVLVFTSCANSTTPASLDSAVRETNNKLRTILASEPAEIVDPISWDGRTQTLTTSTGETHTFPSANNTSEVKYVMWGSSKSWCMIGVTEQGTSTLYGSEENNTCPTWLTANPFNYENYINQQAEYDPVNNVWFTTTPILNETPSDVPSSIISVSKNGGISWEKTKIDPTLTINEEYAESVVTCAPVGCLAMLVSLNPETTSPSETSTYPSYKNPANYVLSYDAENSTWTKTSQLPENTTLNTILLGGTKPLIFNDNSWIVQTIAPSFFAMRSNDNGASWEPLSSLLKISNKDNERVAKINSNSIASNNGTLLATVRWEKTEEETGASGTDTYVENVGVAKSEDNGNTWTLMPSLSSLQPSSGSYVIAGNTNEWMVYDGSSFKSWVTSNNGKTWNVTLAISNDTEYPASREFINNVWVVNVMKSSLFPVLMSVTQYLSFDPKVENWWPKQR